MKKYETPELEVTPIFKADVFTGDSAGGFDLGEEPVEG